MESAIRNAIRDEKHPPAELYMDELYFRSLKLDYAFKKKVPVSDYKTRIIKRTCNYYYSSIENISDNLEPQ